MELTTYCSDCAPTHAPCSAIYALHLLPMSFPEFPPMVHERASHSPQGRRLRFSYLFYFIRYLFLAFAQLINKRLSPPARPPLSLSHTHCSAPRRALRARTLSLSRACACALSSSGGARRRHILQQELHNITAYCICGIRGRDARVRAHRPKP
jgi:hypothetical protein